MQEFFMDYGLWLLIALLVVIGLVFLLSGKGKSAAVEDPAPVAPPVAAEPIAEPVGSAKGRGHPAARFLVIADLPGLPGCPATG